MKILGIETSCDETAAAVIEDGRTIHSNVVASQIEMHAEYGGIVPELASRQHMLTFNAVVREALEQASIELRDLDGIAVTYGPGLAGALLVGVNAAKGLALAEETPLVGINHLEGHIYAAWLEDIQDPATDPGFPLLCLIASGGHTDLVLMRDHRRYELVGQTRDDAAGEAFDKAARVLGLGFPGGPEIQKMSEHPHGPEKRFPRPNVKNSLDFSFSGLKTAMLHRAQEKGWYPPGEEQIDEFELAGVAAAFPRGSGRQHRHPLRGRCRDLPGSRDRARRRCRRQQPPPPGDRGPLTRARHRSSSRPVHRQRRNDRGRRLAPPA